MNRLVVALAVLASFAVPVAAQGLTEANRPVYKVGDSWTYSYHDERYGRPPSAYTMTVQSIGGDKMSIGWVNPDVNESGTFQVNMDFNNLGQDSGGHTYPIPNFHYPLKVGEVWHEKYRYSAGTAQGPADYDADMTTTVAGVKSVTVPAGTFETFKIVVVMNYVGHSRVTSGSWSGTVTSTWYVSPQVENYVKRVFVDSGTSPSPLIRELLKYHLQ